MLDALKNSLVVCGIALSILGCAKKPMAVNLRSVLDEAAQNELAPTVRLTEKDLLIEGVVVRTGMRSELSREGTAQEVGLGMIKSESHQVVAQVPFAIIEPGDGKPGRCMCFFDPVWLEELAAYKPKSKMRVLAQLQRFVRQDEHEVLAADCSFID